MQTSFEQLLGKVTTQLVMEQVEQYQGQPLLLKETVLCVIDKNRLAHKILLLPYEQQSILFSRYCFGSRPQETERTLELDRVRGRLMVETFPQFSVFWTDAVQGEMAVSLDDLVVGYLPNGFVLENMLADDTIIACYHTNATGEAIDLILEDTTFVLHLDTENAQLHQLVIKDAQAYWWEKEGAVHIVWQQGGWQCSLTAPVSFEEALKIAESVTAKKSKKI